MPNKPKSKPINSVCRVWLEIHTKISDKSLFLISNIAKRYKTPVKCIAKTPDISARVNLKRELLFVIIFIPI